MMDGYTADDAIALIREKRDRNTLFNLDFVRKLQALPLSWMNNLNENNVAHAQIMPSACTLR